MERRSNRLTRKTVDKSALFCGQYVGMVNEMLSLCQHKGPPVFEPCGHITRRSSRFRISPAPAGTQVFPDHDAEVALREVRFIRAA